MNVYQAKQFDMEGVAKLFNLYRQFYEKSTNLAGARQFIEESLFNKDSIIFVAKKGREYIGFTHIYSTYSSISTKKAWILNDLFVKESNRKAGVASNY